MGNDELVERDPVPWHRHINIGKVLGYVESNNPSSQTSQTGESAVGIDLLHEVNNPLGATERTAEATGHLRRQGPHLLVPGGGYLSEALQHSRSPSSTTEDTCIALDEPPAIGSNVVAQEYPYAERVSELTL